MIVEAVTRDLNHGPLLCHSYRVILLFLSPLGFHKLLRFSVLDTRRLDI